MANYDRRPIEPLKDAWLLDSDGKIVGAELARASNQKTYLSSSATEGTIDGDITGDLIGNVTGDLVGVAANLTTIATGNSVSVPANSQAAIFGSLTVDGTLTVAGEVRVVSWPS